MALAETAEWQHRIIQGERKACKSADIIERAAIESGTRRQLPVIVDGQGSFVACCSINVVV